MDTPKILIVDDERANQFLLEGLLRANGFETRVASDGDECFTVLGSFRPDLILLDIMMPRMSGIEVLEKIMISEDLKQIPVIMVSAKTASTDIKKALETGAIDYIKKPFEETELLARISVGIRLKTEEDHLREMISQREEFVRIISHDLRSPFTAINGFAELLLSDDNLTGDQKESLKLIIDSVEFSLEYFNKLLSWAKLEQKDIGLNKKLFSLERIVQSSIRFHERKAVNKGIQLTSSIDPKQQILVDEIYFRQVVENLLSNAIKFTPSGGTIRCLSALNGKNISLVISDTGIGIPDDISPDELFSKKYIQSRRGTNNEKGTGIGLSICKKILDAHGFQISYQANASGGSDFIISLGETKF
jgi:two-component system, sensor histidine kinase and response regulator